MGSSTAVVSAIAIVTAVAIFDTRTSKHSHLLVHMYINNSKEK